MSSTTEDYLKQILVASLDRPEEPVSPGLLAERMGLTPGTITSMMKTLEGTGLVKYIPRRGVSLTENGRSQAVAVLRRHRLIELFLVEVLDLDWVHVHDEAEVLEHAFSDRILARIDEILGHPESDPHGDPIPRTDGSIPEILDRPLSELESVGKLRVTRVEHHEAAFLGFLGNAGITPGTVIRIGRRDHQAGTLVLQIGDQEVTLSMAAAGRIRVIQV
jgi:DtxR family Mn-dependent transcriptional regulator